MLDGAGSDSAGTGHARQSRPGASTLASAPGRQLASCGQTAARLFPTRCAPADKAATSAGGSGDAFSFTDLGDQLKRLGSKIQSATSAGAQRGLDFTKITRGAAASSSKGPGTEAAPLPAAGAGTSGHDAAAAAAASAAGAGAGAGTASSLLEEDPDLEAYLQVGERQRGGHSGGGGRRREPCAQTANRAKLAAARIDFKAGSSVRRDQAGLPLPSLLAAAAPLEGLQAGRYVTTGSSLPGSAGSPSARFADTMFPSTLPTRPLCSGQVAINTSGGGSGEDEGSGGFDAVGDEDLDLDSYINELSAEVEAAAAAAGGEDGGSGGEQAPAAADEGKAAAAKQD